MLIATKLPKDTDVSFITEMIEVMQCYLGAGTLTPIAALTCFRWQFFCYLQDTVAQADEVDNKYLQVIFLRLIFRTDFIKEMNSCINYGIGDANIMQLCTLTEILIIIFLIVVLANEITWQPDERFSIIWVKI